jgi:hypothetical protein
VFPEQMQRLELQEATTRPVTVSPDGRLVSGIDIEIRETPAD